MKKVQEVDGGDGRTTVWMHWMPLSYTLKMVKIVYFMLCVFPRTKKLEKKFVMNIEEHQVGKVPAISSANSDSFQSQDIVF